MYRAIGLTERTVTDRREKLFCQTMEATEIIHALASIVFPVDIVHGIEWQTLRNK